MSEKKWITIGIGFFAICIMIFITVAVYLYYGADRPGEGLNYFTSEALFSLGAGFGLCIAFMIYFIRQLPKPKNDVINCHKFKKLKEGGA
jgi:hypothetical protein